MKRTLFTAATLLVVLMGVAVFLVPRLVEESPSSSAGESFAAQRLAMVESDIAARGVDSASVLRAMRRVPRHEFVPDDQIGSAYADRPLPIGFGQTISQPYIVALMSELAQVRAGDKVLEIGTGSGYQAAVLAELTDRVYSIEIVPELAGSAAERLKRIGYPSVRVREGDGYLGWKERAPFDAIVVTAAPDHVPPPLVGQLAEGGRMVIPVGPPGSYQTLWRIRRTGGRVVSENITGVIFVPLVRQER